MGEKCVSPSIAREEAQQGNNRLLLKSLYRAFRCYFRDASAEDREQFIQTLRENLKKPENLKEYPCLSKLHVVKFYINKSESVVEDKEAMRKRPRIR